MFRVLYWSLEYGCVHKTVIIIFSDLQYTSEYFIIVSELFNITANSCGMATSQYVNKLNI